MISMVNTARAAAAAATNRPIARSMHYCSVMLSNKKSETESASKISAKHNLISMAFTARAAATNRPITRSMHYCPVILSNKRSDAESASFDTEALHACKAPAEYIIHHSGRIRSGSKRRGSHSDSFDSEPLIACKTPKEYIRYASRVGLEVDRSGGKGSHVKIRSNKNRTKWLIISDPGKNRQYDNSVRKNLNKSFIELLEYDNANEDVNEK